MNATQGRYEATDVAKARLRRAFYEDLTTQRGATTIDERAKLFGLHRSTIVRIQEQHTEPGLGVAMHIAHTLGVPVEALWLRRDEVA